HELRGNLAAGALATMAVGERHAEDIVGGAFARRDLRGLAKPPGEAVLPALDAIAVRRAVLLHEESGGGRELEEMVVQGRGQRLLVGEDERRRAPDQRHVLVAEAD